MNPLRCRVQHKRVCRFGRSKGWCCKCLTGFQASSWDAEHPQELKSRMATPPCILPAGGQAVRVWAVRQATSPLLRRKNQVYFKVRKACWYLTYSAVTNRLWNKARNSPREGWQLLCWYELVCQLETAGASTVNVAATGLLMTSADVSDDISFYSTHIDKTTGSGT